MASCSVYKLAMKNNKKQLSTDLLHKVLQAIGGQNWGSVSVLFQAGEGEGPEGSLMIIVVMPYTVHHIM